MPSPTGSATFTTLVGDVTLKTWTDPYACVICGRPRPWHVWFNKDGKGCYHPKPYGISVKGADADG